MSSEKKLNPQPSGQEVNRQCVKLINQEILFVDIKVAIRSI